MKEKESSLYSFLPLCSLYVFFFNFWLLWVLIAVRGLSLVAVGGSCSLVGVHRLLTAMASLLVEHRL